GQGQQRGIVSPGTEHSAIWPPDFVFLYTIVSLARASVQDFAGFVPATGGSLPPPDPASLISVSLFSVGRKVPSRDPTRAGSENHGSVSGTLRPNLGSGRWPVQFLLVTDPCHGTSGFAESTERSARHLRGYEKSPGLPDWLASFPQGSCSK